MFATIYAPNFYLQAVLRYQPDLAGKPVALLDEQTSKAIILQLNSHAKNRNVNEGMTASQGLARCLQLVIKTRLPSQEKLLDEILLQHAAMLAPYVEATAPGICTVRFTDRRNLADKILRVIERLADTKIVAQAGIAAAPNTSFLAAHLAKPVLQIDDAKDFLAALPIEVLRTLESGLEFQVNPTLPNESSDWPNHRRNPDIFRATAS